jgi:PAS domain S-box-containing protein
MKIRTHLFFLVFGTLLPILLFAVALTAMFWREERSAFEQGFQERVRAISFALDRDLDGQIRLLQHLAQSELLRSKRIGEFYEEAARARAAHTIWSTVIVADPSGRPLLNLHSAPGATVPTMPVDNATFQRVVNSGAPAVSSLFKDPGTDKYSSAILVPVKSDASVIYVLAAVIENSPWLEFLASYPGPRDATTTLLDQNGAIIARTVNNDSSAGQRAGLFTKLQQVAEAVYRSVEPQGQQYFSAQSRSQISAWTVASGMSRNAIALSLWGPMLAAAVGATAALLLAITLACLFGKRIARSVSGLARVARGFTAGQPAPSMPASNVTEINETANAFTEVRKQLQACERELRESEEKFRTLTTHAPVGIFLTDLKGEYYFVNRNWCAVSGLTAQQAKDTGWQRALHPEDRHRVLTEWRAAVQQGLPFSSEFRFLQPNGTVTWLQGSAAELRNSHDSVVGYIGTISNITGLKQAEEAMRLSEEKLRGQAQELEQQLIASGRLVSLGEVTASMAHEFNNPLGIVMGFAQDMLSETDPSSQNYQSLRIIDEETRRCQKIIQELLEFARPRSTDLGLTDVKQMIEKTLNLVSNHLYKQKIEATSAVDSNLPQIYADVQQLEQVLVNLYLNAVDAMPIGGSLKVEAKQDKTASGNPTIVISVVDTGFGIDDKDLPKIFLPFFSARKRKGLGLGLPICERIIKNHGGRIEVESRSGKGTTFRIFLPVDHQPESVAGAETRADSSTRIPQ